MVHFNVNNNLSSIFHPVDRASVCCVAKTNILWDYSALFFAEHLFSIVPFVKKMK